MDRAFSPNPRGGIVLRFVTTIRARLLLLALLALAPLLAMLLHAALAVHRVREESELTANLELARATAAAFSAFVDDVSRTALPLGEALASGHLTADEETALLAKTAAAYRSVRELSWASPGGRILVSSNPRVVGLDVSDRDYHLRVLAGDDQAVSDLLLPRSGAEASFVIARAVRASGGRLVGTVLAVIDPARLHERALPPIRSGDAALSLVDRAGRVVYRAPAQELSWEDREAVAGQDIVRRALRGEEAAGAFPGLAGGERLGAAVPVHGIGWAARASRDAREAFGPVRREFLRAGLLAAIAAAASLGASALLGRRIVRALRRLEDHAEALGRGDDVAVPAPAPSDVPEIAHLAGTYGRMAEKLRASREALQTAFECAPAGILLLDGGALRARWANRAFLELLEEPHASAGIAGARVEEFLPGAEALGLVHSLSRVASGAVPQLDAEYRFERFAGASRWSRWAMRAIRSSERASGRDVLVVATDVTEQVMARRRVEEDRGRLEAVLDALPAGVIIVDAAGRVVEANPAARAIWGGALPEPAAARGWWAESGAPLGPEDWPVLRALSRGEASLGELVDVERLDGQRATVLVNAVPIRGAGGAITGAVAALQDVSELRRARRRERILLDAGAVLAETLELDDAAGRLARFAVPLVADLCAVDEVLPDGTLRPLALAHRDPDEERRLRAALARRGAPGSPPLAHRAVAERVTLHVPDVSAALPGTPSEWPEHLAHLRSWIVVPLVASGTVVGVLTLATADGGARLDDEDVRLAEELGWRAAQALDNARLFGEVQRAVRSRDEVLSVVSHDLRNPLGVVTLGARLVSELPDAPGSIERARGHGRRIQAAGDRMARLIGDLLDLAALQEGRLAVERTACAPPDLLREAVDEARGAAQARGLELRCEAEPGLPPVACDHGRILQVLGNLLSNAVKVTERGRIEVSASRGERGVVFSVADTGPGISPEEQARLFERFRRGARATYQGTGLGLAISRALVEAHGGRIWLESREGEGATFRFTLPAAAAGAAAAVAPGCEGQAGGAPGRGAAGEDFAAAGER